MKLSKPDGWMSWTEPMGVQRVAIAPEISDDEMREFQVEELDFGPVSGWPTDSPLPPTS